MPYVYFLSKTYVIFRELYLRTWNKIQMLFQQV